MSPRYRTNQDVGKGIADMLVDQFVRDGNVLGHRAETARQSPDGNKTSRTAIGQSRHGGQARPHPGGRSHRDRQHHHVRPRRQTTKVGGGVLDRMGPANTGWRRQQEGIEGRGRHHGSADPRRDRGNPRHRRRHRESQRSGMGILGSGGAGTVAGGDYSVGVRISARLCSARPPRTRCRRSRASSRPMPPGFRLARCARGVVADVKRDRAGDQCRFKGGSAYRGPLRSEACECGPSRIPSAAA